MDFLPKDDNRPAAAPESTFEPATDNATPDYAAEAAGIPFEWESFPGASAPDVPAPGTQPTPASGLTDDPVEASWTPSTSFDRPEPPASSSFPGNFPAEASANTGNDGLDFLAEDLPAGDHPVASPVNSPAPAAPIASGKAVQATPPRTGMGTRQLAMVGGGVLAAGALIFTILGMRGAASPEPVATPAPARRATAKAPTKAAPFAQATPAPAARAVNVDADAPRWSRVSDGRWVSANRQSAAFEVAATSRVHVWMRDVTPVLVVRCEKGNAETFVYTQSAARMEPQDGDHTVQVSFDGASPASQRWPDSAEHDALFARNPLEFTRQLTHARTLQFGFTPHNADTVVATFVLDGLEPLLASSAKQCGWHNK